MATFYSGYSNTYRLILEVNQTSQDKVNNKSYLSWVLKMSCGAQYYQNQNTKDSFYVKINGQVVYNTTKAVYFSGANTTVTIASGSNLAVSHNADGSKTVAASFSFSPAKTASYYPSAMSGSGNLTLTKIPRQAKLTAAPNFTDEDNPTITYSNPAGNIVTSLKACIASADGKTVYAAYRDISKTGSSYTFNLTEEEREALRWATINSNTLTVKFYVSTVLNGITYYSTLDKILTITNAKPTLAPTVKDTGGYSTPLTGDANNLIIKGFNYMSVSIGAQTYKGASIKAQSITCGDAVINGATGGFSNVETASFIFSVTDSRGNTTTQTITKTLIEYIKLTCNLKANNPTADGKMSLKISGNYFDGNFGAIDNTLDVAFRYKENNGEYSDWIAASATISGDTYEAIVELTGLNYQSTYTFQAKATDKVNAIESAERKVKSIPVFDWGENDFAVNVDLMDKFNTLISNGLAEYEDGTIDVNETLSHLCLAQYNTPNNSLYYVMTFFYGTKSTETNRTQMAIPYIYDKSQNKKEIYIRQYINGEWNDWGEIKTSNTKREWVYQLPVVNSVSANSWQQIATNLTTDKLPAGKYEIIFSASINGHSSGISTLNPYMDGGRLDTHTRCSIPLNNALQTSGICFAYAEFTTEATHTVNIHNYSNVGVGPKYAQVRFIRID